MICIPITAPASDAAIKQIKEAQEKADLIELRLDLIKDSKNSLKKLILSSKVPVIATHRLKSEGGKADPGEKHLKLLVQSAIFGAGYVDIELSSGEKQISSLRKSSASSKLIVSFHDFEKTGDIKDKYAAIRKLNPDIIKIASMANDITDNLKIRDLLKISKKDKQETIALCMGQKGSVSRILGPFWGSFLTFASLDPGSLSAPGQVTISELLEKYHLREKKDPSVYGLLGNPVSHSQSYVIHNHAFHKLGLDAVYLNFLVDDLGAFMASFKKELKGLSVTIPFKQRAVKYCAGLDVLSKRIGAVNTIVFHGGKALGYNTDAIAIRSLLEEKIRLKGKSALVIGAGGVARAAVAVLRCADADVTVCNRTYSRAQSLAEEFSCRSIPLSDIGSSGSYSLIINCTSVGMHPDIESAPLEKRTLKKITDAASIVFDTVYTPKNTVLLKEASSLGLATIPGTRMFQLQAIEQFRIFTGKVMPA